MMTRQLLNTLFVQTQGAYLRLDHDTVRVDVEGATALRVPLHHLGGLAVFGNVLLSPFLLHRCAQERRQVVWFSQYGRFQARLHGSVTGNVLLRHAQHQAYADARITLTLARAFVDGKARATHAVLSRARREAATEEPTIVRALSSATWAREALAEASNPDAVRGVEGQMAAEYFRAFPSLLHNADFSFGGRSRRPPLDAVNALLSFVYALIRGDCEAALEGVGLDPQIGFLHVLRPGRPALALDLMESFRAWWGDRLVLTLLNRRQLAPSHFDVQPGGAVHLTDAGRREVLTAYQKRKADEVSHPLFTEPVPVGLLPYVQARLLARHLRGDLEHYTDFVPR